MKQFTSHRNTAKHRRTVENRPGRINAMLVVSFAAVAITAVLLAGIGGSFKTSAAPPMTFMVTNTNDSGPGSLRQAILDANANPGADTINFSIPGTGVQTIKPTLANPLPSIIDPVVIDGYTQQPCIGNPAPCSHPNTLAAGDDAVILIEISNELVTSGANGFVIATSGGGSTIRGLAIDQGFSRSIQMVNSSNNIVDGCFIGTDASGLVAHGNGRGVEIAGTGSSNNLIGGTTPAARNVISGNNEIGVFMNGPNNLVQGNFIGTDATGTVALTSQRGVVVEFNDNLIGGTTVTARNVIASNGTNTGVVINASTGNRIQGNFIGTDVTGTIALGFVEGVELLSSSSNTQVGGPTAIPGTPPGNVISGNSTGVFWGNLSSNNTIQGNLIGTNASGTSALGNSLDGIAIRGSSNVIGGSAANVGNVISANGRHGINIGDSDAPANDNLVQGNLIGTDVTGNNALGNGGSGVLAFKASANRITGNSIAFNGALGINLVGGTENPFGVTANDDCDGDTGANNLQNFPIINSAVKSGSDLLIEGTLNSTASSSFTLDFYANDSCDASSNGEGKIYLGSANVMTGANCIADFTGANKITITPPTQLTSGQRVTATAIDANGNTSEFSACGGPTAIQIVDCTATAFDDGTLLQWRTAHEVDNLGFNIFRDENGNRVRVNRQLIAGSALLVGPSIRLGAGYSYAWKDATPDSQNAAYWLEDVDLKGGSTWHGPVSVQRSDLGSHKSEITTAVLLSDLGKEGTRTSSSRLEATAKMEFAAAPVKSQALASQPAVKIAVKHEGWYRVTQLELAALGFDPRINPRVLQLFVDGRELPIAVQGEQDGRFDPADSIEFYGLGLDSPFTDSRVYWLIAGDRPGLRVNSTKFEGSPSSSESFTAVVERRDRTVYFSALRNGEKENFFGAVIANPVEQHLTLSHLARTSNSSAELEIAVQGVTFTSHSINIELNGAWVGEITFNGQSQGAAKINVAQSLLREGENVVRLSPLGGQSDISLVDYVRVSYEHAYLADGDSLRLTAAGKEQISVDGFASKTIRVFDVTDANSPQELIGTIDQTKNTYRVSFSSAANGQRNLLCISNETRPAALAMNLPSSLRDLNASYLIITRRDFFESLNPLAALHQHQGLSVAAIDIEDIYDEFSFGQKTPYAVREFLARAKKNWKKKVRFVVFAGDASLDPKNYLGLGDSDSVPTKLIDTQFLETSSDDWFSDFNGDGIADIATGRLPARTAEELISIVSKIVQYEHSSVSDEALLVADADEGFAFEQACSELISLIPTNLRITQVYRGRLDAEKARGSLFEALYREQFLVNYVGHGSVNLWSGNLLTSTDAQDLQNEHLPMFVMMTCLNGYFHDPALDSLGESLIKAERGGAIAVWASSGMTMPEDQALINKELYRLLFNRDSALSLGEAVMRAKSSALDADVRRTWILLGDPAILLR